MRDFTARDIGAEDVDSFTEFLGGESDGLEDLYSIVNTSHTFLRNQAVNVP